MKNILNNIRMYLKKKLHLFSVITHFKKINRQLKELERESEEYHKNNFRQREKFYKQKEFGKLIDLIGEGTKYILDTIDKRRDIKKGLFLFK